MEEYFKELKFLPIDKFKSPEDKRNYIFNASVPFDTSLPSSFSWKDKVKFIRDQKQYGSCFSQAIAQYKNIVEQLDNAYVEGGFSALYNFALSDSADGIVGNGVVPSIGLDKLLKFGILPEKDMPYSFLLDNGYCPSITEVQIEKALPYKISGYSRIFDDDIDGLKRAIVQAPVPIGIMATDAFVRPDQNKFAKPKLDGNFYGGHMILCVSFNDCLEHVYPDGSVEKGFVEILNSWSDKWANDGYCYIPYSAFKNKTEEGLRYVVEMWSVQDDHSNKKNASYYRVQVGAFSQKSNCEKLAQELKNKGFSTYIVNVNNLYKVQVGCFSIRTNAEKLSQQLTNAGYKNFITQY